MTPPQRGAPKMIYLRLRHPEEKKIQGVTLNGKAHDQFDVDKEWVILPGNLKGEQQITVRY